MTQQQLDAAYQTSFFLSDVKGVISTFFDKVFVMNKAILDIIACVNCNDSQLEETGVMKSCTQVCFKRYLFST